MGTPRRRRSENARRLQVRVRSISYEGEYINAYEVVDPEGKRLPAFTAGAHVDLYFRDGRIRQYSLCNDPAERDRYVFGVQREAQGRGGSIAIFEKVHVGRILTISEPRNNFPLAEAARHHLLLAGGIGVTPMMAMVQELERRGADWTLHYCTRTPEKTAFREKLAPLARAGRVQLHHDLGVPADGLDIARLLKKPRPGTHLYYCGPPGFMAAAAKVCAHWPRGTVHFEHFSVPEAEVLDTDATPGDNRIGIGFQVKLASSGAVYDVPNDKSIVQVLREHGVEIATSCESGLCGTCRTRFLSGEPEHRDFVLDDEERQQFVMPCCARARSPVLVLDL